MLDMRAFETSSTCARSKPHDTPAIVDRRASGSPDASSTIHMGAFETS
jgi:hypothetical protein